MKELVGFRLVSNQSLLVRGYVGLLGAGGVVCGLAFGSVLLAMLGGILLGAYVSPSLPIWSKATTDQDRALIEKHNEDALGLRYFYWAIPLSVLGLIALVAVEQFFGTK